MPWTMCWDPICTVAEVWCWLSCSLYFVTRHFCVWYSDTSDFHRTWTTNVSATLNIGVCTAHNLKVCGCVICTDWISCDALQHSKRHSAISSFLIELMAKTIKTESRNSLIKWSTAFCNMKNRIINSYLQFDVLYLFFNVLTCFIN